MSKSRFAGKVKQSVHNQDKKENFGYINLPEDMEFFDPMKCRPKDKKIWTVKLDFLPYIVTNEFHQDRDSGTGAAMVDEAWFRSIIMVHNNVNKKKEICLKTFGKACPICDYQREQLDKGVPWKEVSHLKPSKRDVFIVVPILDDNYEQKPYIWDMSQYNFSRLLQEELADTPENEVFPDLEEGLTLKIRFSTGEFVTGSKTIQYPETSRIDFIERDKKYSWDMLEDMPKLDDLYIVKEYKDLEAEFFQTEQEHITQEPDDTEEETPQRKKKTLNECPHGHEFGKDAGTKDECAECDKLDTCLDNQVGF